MCTIFNGLAVRNVSSILKPIILFCETTERYPIFILKMFHLVVSPSLLQLLRESIYLIILLEFLYDNRCSCYNGVLTHDNDLNYKRKGFW